MQLSGIIQLIHLGLTAVLLYLVLSQATLDPQVTDDLFSQPHVSDQFDATDTSATRSQPSPDNDFFTEQLRQLIREEVTRALHASAVANTPPARQVSEANTTQDARIYQQLYDYLSSGSINEAEMENLQLSLARLSPQKRTEAFRQLSQAINSGHLKLQ